jgi:threonine synthase
MTSGAVTTPTAPAITRSDPDLGPARHLSCRECGATTELGPFYACGECFGPLEVAYEFGADQPVTRASIEAGPQNIWRYQGLLPVPSTVRDVPNL